MLLTKMTSLETKAHSRCWYAIPRPSAAGRMCEVLLEASIPGRGVEVAMHRRDVVANVRDGAAAATPADRVGFVIARTAREDEAATARIAVGVMTDILGVVKGGLYMRRKSRRVKRPKKQQGDYYHDERMRAGYFVNSCVAVGRPFISGFGRDQIHVAGHERCVGIGRGKRLRPSLQPDVLSQTRRIGRQSLGIGHFLRLDHSHPSARANLE